MQTKQKTFPVVDLFAGPGGLGEGFSAYQSGSNRQPFRVCLSIEKEKWAHQTLLHRTAFRNLKRTEDRLHFLELLASEDSRSLGKVFSEEISEATAEAWRAELGNQVRTEDDPACEHPDRNTVERKIKSRLPNPGQRWVLLGGPPCQAYSLVGRARNMGKADYKAEDDHRHFLYKEYLSTIAHLWPSVFVMENVKGILSARIDGQLIFNQILKDLKNPAGALRRDTTKSHRYRVLSLTLPIDGQENELLPSDFVVRCENHGIPQARHRVILLGVRDDISLDSFQALSEVPSVSVEEALHGLPVLRSLLSNRTSRTGDCDTWITALRTFPLDQLDAEGYFNGNERLRETLRLNLQRVGSHSKSFTRTTKHSSPGLPPELSCWYADGLAELTERHTLNHDARSHMREDLWRYFFASTYATVFGTTPPLTAFPDTLIPNHKNLKTFLDRFRVQVASRPSTTVTSHISKDGHYYIHYDPLQCRSLTVREAARLQTFPDTYFFCGPRTVQYQQVGNAVPPYLAQQIAGIVHRLLAETPGRTQHG